MVLDAWRLRPTGIIPALVAGTHLSASAAPRRFTPSLP
jgi:hypothetical protein